MVDFAIDIGNAFIKMAANQIASGFMTNISPLFSDPATAPIGGGPTPPTVYANAQHLGGLIGVTRGTPRSVSTGTFSRAPRLHEGLNSDEFPAILQSGERVIKRGSGSPSQQPPNIILNFEDKTDKGIKPTQGKTQFNGKDYVTNIILEDSATFGPLRSGGIIG